MQEDPKLQRQQESKREPWGGRSWKDGRRDSGTQGHREGGPASDVGGHGWGGSSAPHRMFPTSATFVAGWNLLEGETESGQGEPLAWWHFQGRAGTRIEDRHRSVGPWRQRGFPDARPVPQSFLSACFVPGSVLGSAETEPTGLD